MLLELSMRVRPVKGRMILNPATIGAREHRRIGYSRVVAGQVNNMRTGQPEPRIRYVFGDGSPEVVRETGDGYLRKAIHDGDLEYIEHVNPDGSTYVDESLLAVTRKHFPEKAKAEGEGTESSADAAPVVAGDEAPAAAAT